MEAYSIFLFCSSLLSILILSTATDIITSSQSLTDNKTLVSVNGSFELGFFSPGNNSTRRYLGIWYKTVSIKTVVWVANRDIPLVGSSGVLNFTNRGNLVLLNFNETTIWSSNSSRSALNPVAQLLESGNFVVREENDTNPENYLWQSFDYPCDTQLPGMKLGRNTITGQEWYLTSWKSTDDPARGDFTYRLDPQGYPQLLIKEGTVEKFRSGPWNGLRWSGFPSLRPNSIYTYYFIFNQTVMIYSYDLINASVITKSGIDPEGIVARSIWIDEAKRWNLYRATQTDNCDTYALCGVYGSCNIDDSPICGCLKGFVPKFPNAWEVSDWSSGCVRRTALDCQKGDGFIKYTGVKLPDTRSSWFNVSMSLEECRVMCLRNCTCMAYTSLDISAGGSGCLLWFNELIDIKVFIQNGQEIYIRMAASEVAALGSDRNRRVKIIVGTVLPGLFLLCLVLALYICKKKKPNRPAHIAGKKGYYAERGNAPDSQQEDLELPLFDMSTVAKATNDFSFNNKLGEGGFGPVYKGVLDGGQEIAVKRLSQFSKQGLDEFMNEVLCIAKLQHRNLVKLLGCCIEEEKMLIYEYMPNKSLDFFIFDETRSGSLNWHKRFQIICGIARGLLYLHQDSRLRIIHRDLKASNVLLDYEMNPKISDFGMARSFGGNETGANTTRVVGTYGYMSPEYAIDGLFSTKSDIFSFGVLVLEIVSGKKNRGFQHPDHHHNLLGHAWKLYKEGRPLELVDASVEDSSNLTEVLRSIHVGLLCVQQAPEERPSMSSVVMMLGSDTTLPQPKQPGFFAERNPFEGDSSSSKAETFSANEMSFTLLTAR